MSIWGKMAASNGCTMHINIIYMHINIMQYYCMIGAWMKMLDFITVGFSMKIINCYRGMRSTCLKKAKKSLAAGWLSEAGFKLKDLEVEVQIDNVQILGDLKIKCSSWLQQPWDMEFRILWGRNRAISRIKNLHMKRANFDFRDLLRDPMG